MPECAPGRSYRHEAVKGGAVGGPPELPAASGGIGGTTQGFGSEEEYKRAYIDCMRGGGHNVIN